MSTVMLCAGILIVTYFAVPWIQPGSLRGTIAIGFAWLALTLTFESGLAARAGQAWRLRELRSWTQ